MSGPHHRPVPGCPTAAELREHVRDAIDAHRDAVAAMQRRGRHDLAHAITCGIAGRGYWLEAVRHAFAVYHARHRAELAHARGEHLDRRFIWH